MPKVAAAGAPGRRGRPRGWRWWRRPPAAPAQAGCCRRRSPLPRTRACPRSTWGPAASRKPRQALAGAPGWSVRQTRSPAWLACVIVHRRSGTCQVGLVGHAQPTCHIQPHALRVGSGSMFDPPHRAACQSAINLSSRPLVDFGTTSRVILRVTRCQAVYRPTASAEAKEQRLTVGTAAGQL